MIIRGTTMLMEDLSAADRPADPLPAMIAVRPTPTAVMVRLIMAPTMARLISAAAIMTVASITGSAGTEPPEPVMAVKGGKRPFETRIEMNSPTRQWFGRHARQES